MTVPTRAPATAVIPRLDADEALIALIIGAMEANGHAAPSEAARAEHIVWSMSRFRNRSGAVVGSLIARMKALAGSADPAELRAAAARAVPLRLRTAAFAIAADVVLVDGRLERAERQFLVDLARQLRVSQARALAILDVIRMKNRA
jgi:hypothetical protein